MVLHLAVNEKLFSCEFPFKYRREIYKSNLKGLYV
jgi:hypothetical protein